MQQAAAQERRQQEVASLADFKTNCKLMQDGLAVNGACSPPRFPRSPRRRPRLPPAPADEIPPC